MIEILNIFFLIASIIWICSFPLVQSNSKTNFVFNKLENLEKNCINLSILLNFFLILSFYDVNLKYIFIFLLVLPLINFIPSKESLSFTNLVILFFFIFILSITIGSNLKLEYDGAAIWIYKTINFFSENNFNNLSKIPGYIEYPHLGSYLWAFFWNNSLIDSEYTGRIFFVFCYCLSILLIISSTKIILSKKILIISFFLLLTLDYYLLAGYQEYLVFSFLIFIFYFYFKYFVRKQKIFLVPVILFINAILWVKNEASIFVLFFFLFIIFHHLIEKNKIKNEIYILGIFFILSLFVKYLIFYNAFNAVNTGWPGYQINNFGTVFQLDYFLERTSSIIINISVALIKCKVYLMFFLTLLFFLNKKNCKFFLPFIFFLLLNLILIFFIYYLTDSVNWKIYQAMTVDRLLFQTSGIYLIPILYILKKNFKLQRKI